MEDPRQQALQDSICATLGVDAGAVAAAMQSDAVTAFLDDGTVTLLQAALNSSNDISITHGAATYSDTTVASVLYSKSGGAPVAPGRFSQDVTVTVMKQSPIDALYHSIHQIYGPMLAQDPRFAANPELRSLLNSLDSSLSTVVRSDASKGCTHPCDEFEYWQQIANSGSRDQEKAKSFSEHFDEIAPLFADMRSSNSGISLNEMLSVINKTGEALDAVWQLDFPQSRMDNLLELVGLALAQFIQNRIGENDLWSGTFAKVESMLHEGTEICKQWLQEVNFFTNQKWPQELNQWDNSAQGPDGYGSGGGMLHKVQSRLMQILEIRKVHHELQQCLPRKEQTSLSISTLLDAFKGFNALLCTPHAESQWTTAVAEYERKRGEAEGTVAKELRFKLNSLKGQSRALLRESSKYEALLKLPNVARELASERENLLAELSKSLHTHQEEFDQRSSGDSSGPKGSRPPQGRNLPDVVATIVWVRQLQHKVMHTKKTAESLLSNLPGYEKFTETYDELLESLQYYEREKFDLWKSEVNDQIQDWLGDGVLVEEEARNKRGKEIHLSGNLMEFNFQGAGELVVHFNSRLVDLIKEVRQLVAINYDKEIPKQVTQTASMAARNLRHGVVLNQVANFYNSISNEMFPFQQLMLLREAKAFEKVVTQSNKPSWANESAVEDYVKKLKDKADKLSSENRKLRKLHMNLMTKVSELMSVDLMRNRHVWDAAVKEIKVSFKAAEDAHTVDHVAAWKRFTNRQLYKALEHQYQMGLESLNENLPEIKCELHFHNQALHFRPSLEQLRASYLKELKNFICLPQAASLSLGGDEELFAAMPQRNVQGLLVVFRKGEELFARLVTLRDQLEESLLLGKLTSQEMDAWLEEHLNDVSDWKTHFDLLKGKAKEMEKIPSFYKIDCFNVNTALLKAAVEGQLQNLSDALIISLQKMTKTDLKSVNTFLDGALEQLGKCPQSVDEIGEARQQMLVVSNQKDEMALLFKKCEERGKLLRQMGGSIEMSETNSKWGQLDNSLDAFNQKIEDQQKALKEEIANRIQERQLDVEEFAQKWNVLKPKGEKLFGSEATRIADGIAERKQEMELLIEQVTTLQRDCHNFEMVVPEFPLLDETKEDLLHHEEAWQFFNEWMADVDKVSENKWISYRVRLFAFEEFLDEWTGKVRQRSADDVTLHVQDQIDNLRKLSPLLKYVSGEAFVDEHWSDLFHLLGIKGEVAELTVGDILGCSEKMLSSTEELRHLHARAMGEVVIREAMLELKKWAQETHFQLHAHECDGGRPGVSLIREWKDVLTQVGDNQALLQSLKDSPYFSSFADDATMFETKLAALDEYLHLLNQIQRKWVYLEPIFGRGALPQESHRFKRVDDDFRSIMSSVDSESRVLKMYEIRCDGELLNKKLPTMLDQLERCQKALAEYLEEKRSAFPRFYFIGDDDLLEILGQAKNPTVIQTHLKKLFAAINKVDFDKEEGKTIIKMRSMQGEVVPLSEPVRVTEIVESWLADLAMEMKSTLTKILLESLQGSDPNLRDHPSQILTLSEQVRFTQNCEQAIKSNSLSSLRQDLRTRLEQYTMISTVGDPVMYLKLTSLIFDLIHNIEIVELLQKDAAAMSGDVTCWEWQKQLRYEMNSSRQCDIVMCDARFEYTYEYQGNAPRLVHTPLTDKCYLTLTQGMKYGFGGNPYGPAGTGKTESVKALGQAFGRQVLVFNCDEGIDFQSMGRIFVGLVKCGGWGCFDEFNRLKEDQLSAISQQIQVIQAAIKEKHPTVELLGQSVNVDFNAGIFVTLNPAGKGYGGRSNLPDNLKQLFRSVSMAAPDNNLIAEVTLLSEGFKGARDLGRKVVSIFMLSRQLLSAQQHYDWGLRALKTVLRGAGKLIKDEKESQKDTNVPPEIESRIVIQALRVNTLSKLTFADSQRFAALIGDVFPGVECEDVKDDELHAAVVACLEEMKLEQLGLQMKKIMQFNEACVQRMGVVLVGPSGCGKSTIWQVLRAARMRLGQRVNLHVMNPKAMRRERLLGYMDLDTREWFDGVLTAAARQVVKEPPEVHSWIVCDGDIDPEWVESLNSVLDDNKLLTMPNGERISFGPNVNFIFETHDLCFASPATVSRMGMIFLSDEDMDVTKVVASWLRNQPEATQGLLQGWLDDLFLKSIDYVQQDWTSMVPTTRAGLVLSALSQLTSCTSKAQFVGALIRGLGSNLRASADQEGDADPVNVKRVALAKFVYSLANEVPLNERQPLDCYFDEDAGRYLPYKYINAIEESAVLEARSMPMIKTINAQFSTSVFMPWLMSGQPFILCGPEGAGKTMMLREAFAQCKSVAVATVHCNARTTSEDVIQKLNLACSIASSNTGRVYRPTSAERLILWLRDLNLPQPDKYDTVELIAFLQQLLTHKGFYDANLEFMGLERVQIVVSMTPSTSVGRHELSTRFSAIVRICAVSYPVKSDLIAIFTPLLQHALKKVLPAWAGDRGPTVLGQAMVNIYSKVLTQFSVDEHRHYLFTPRDLSRWVSGLLRYDVASEDELLVAAMYEGQRLFRDRLVNANSLTKLDNIITGQIAQEFGDVAPFDGLYSTWATPEKNGRLGPMTMDDFSDAVRNGLSLYEREFKELNLLLFPEILQHIAHMDRVLSSPDGDANLLLVGRTGVGRRAMVTLISHMHGMELHTPSVTNDFTMKVFRNDIKTVLQVAGVQGLPIVYFLEDHQMVDISFLECINSLLSAGEMPGLYTSEELATLLSPLADEMAQDGRHRNLYSFFVSRVTKNLRIVLSMDPTHPEFQMRCESNPALYNRCTILWMEKFSKETMSQIPVMVLKEFMDEVDKKKTLVRDMAYIHESMIDDGATPQQYITFLHSFQRIYSEKQAQQTETLSHLQSGLSKLEEAASNVDNLSQEAQQSRKKLGVAQAKADDALDKITSAMEAASSRKTEVEQLRGKLASEEQVLNGRKKQVEDELSEIQPMLDAAKSAVGSINTSNLAEIKSLKMPPEPIRDVLEGVLRLMGNYDTSWISMKKFIGSRGVIQEILSFDASRITGDVRAGVEDLLRQKSSSFQHDNIKRVSVAAAPLAQWVVANIQYSRVLEQIGPMRAELEQAKRSLGESQHRLHECEQELGQLDAKVAELKQDFAKQTGEAETLKIKLEKAESTLTAAQTLLGKLTGEKDRWDQQVRDIGLSLESLPGCSLVAAGFVTYLGSAAEDKRKTILQQWFHNVGVEPFSVMRFMVTESELLTWKAGGLPSDDLSMENAIVILNSIQAPMLIDPTTLASQWLKAHLRDKGPLEVVNQHDPRFVNTLELAVRFGKMLLIEEVSDLNPMLYPILRKDLSRQGPRWVVQVGDKAVDYNEGFKVFFTTRNPSMYIPPDAKALISEINFSVTHSGLEGQLLGFTIQNEQPELESQKSELLQKEENLKLQLAELEKNLLQELATSEGNILENKALIDSLNETKAKSIGIANALKDSNALSESLDQQRDVYRPLASRGAVMYFLIEDLQRVNHMYQFSLAVFLNLFKAILSMQTSGGSGVEGRISQLGKQLQVVVLQYICRSLFKADRLTFALHFAHGLLLETFQQGEWELFTGTSAVEAGNTGGLPSWIPQDRMQPVSLLKAVCPSMFSSLGLDDLSTWDRWFHSATPELQFPESLQRRLSKFQLLLVVQALRPDREESAMGVYVCDALEISSLEPASTHWDHIYGMESRAAEPILLITSPGADPSLDLEEFAYRTVGKERFASLPMGGDQAAAAISMLRSAARSGGWVCLKNLHLVVAWIPELEKELNNLTMHEDFRLWLTSEKHPAFSSMLLRSSLKITFEAPPGLRANLIRTYEGWSTEFVERGQTIRSQLFFVLAWFHAIMQERRTYIPQGWVKFYEFSPSDLRIGTDILESAVQRMVAAGSNVVQWDYIHGLFELAIYGGKIDDLYDQKVLRGYLAKYFNNETLANRSDKLLAKGVSIPASAKKEDYRDLVNGLPLNDVPAVFGLPANIDQAVQQMNAMYVLHNLQSMAAVVGSDGGFDREKWSRALNPILKLWSQLCSTGDILSPPGVSDGGDASLLSPVESFVYLEVANSHKLVSVIHESVTAIQKVLQGAALLTSSILADATALMAGEIPSQWDGLWEGPERPQAYLRAVAGKASALKSWVDRVGSQQLLKMKLCLRDLFRPANFLNALRQQAARTYKASMDRLQLVTSSEGSLKQYVSIDVEGLLLQGAVYDGTRLTDVASDSKLLSEMPPLAMAWVRDEDVGQFQQSSTAKIPMYLTPNRDHVVSELSLSCSGEAVQWTIGGTLVCLSDR